MSYSVIDGILDWLMTKWYHKPEKVMTTPNAEIRLDYIGLDRVVVYANHIWLIAWEFTRMNVNIAIWGRVRIPRRELEKHLKEPIVSTELE